MAILPGHDKLIAVTATGNGAVFNNMASSGILKYRVTNSRISGFLNDALSDLVIGKATSFTIKTL